MSQPCCGSSTASAAGPYIDLTTAGSSGSANGALFLQGVGPAGTGQFDPFLTLSTNNPQESGYNSDGSSPQFDTFYGGGRTHPELASIIPPITVGGVLYREFGLDGNDQGSDDYMSIDELKVFLDDQGNLNSYNDSTETFGNDSGSTATKIYDLGANTVLLRTQALSSGSGQSDISVLVPDSLFPANCYYGSTTCDKYVIMFNSDGAAGTLTVGNGCSSGCNYDVTAGFEEWQTRKLPVVNVQKTAVPSFTQTYPWTVKKYVSVDGGTTWVDGSTGLDLFNGQSANVKWKIDYTRGDPVASGEKVTGTVTVANPTGTSPFPFSLDATVSSVSDVLAQTGFSPASVTLTCTGTTFPKTLKPGQSFQCTYTKNVTSTNSGTNTATATLSGGQTYSGHAGFDFSGVTPISKDATANLDDNFDSALPTTVSGTGEIIYDQSQSCGSTHTYTNTAVLTPADSGTPISDPAADTVTCYGLTTTKNATPSFTRSYDWTVKKYVSLDGVNYVDGNVDLNQFVGDSGTLYWKVTPTRSAGTDSGWAATGTITINNPAPIDATGVSVTDTVSGGIAATVDCDPGAGTLTTVDVPHNGSAQCTYSVTLPDAPTRTNTATATLFGQNYTGTASINFTGVDPTLVDATATLGDTNQGSLGAATSGVDAKYTTSAACGDSRTIKNTATVTEGTSGQTSTDDAQATVNCLRLTVTKTATPSFTRAWTWTVDKTSTDSTLTLALGQTFLEPYSVTYQATSHDSAWNVAGSITVTSPANAPSRTVDVTDVYAGNNAAVDCNGATAGTGLPTTLAGGGTLNCTYSVDLGSAVNGNNVATAVLTNVPSGTTNFASDPVPVSFTNPTTETDETINVADTVPAGSYCTGTNTPVAGCTSAGTGPPSGSITATQPSPFTKTFTYTRIIGPYGSGECGDKTIHNVASFTTTDTNTSGSDFVDILVHIPCPTGCTLTQGYWKTHSILGPAPFDDNWNNIPKDPYAPASTGSAENLAFFYSGQTWYQVFWTPPQGGNAYYQLAHQYEAAVLNILNGADPSAVTATLNSALAQLNNSANTPTAIGALKGNDPKRALWISLAGTLGSYNSGQIGPGHCSEDSTTSSAP